MSSAGGNERGDERPRGGVHRRHGNLREALIEAAFAHVRILGAASFSLRDAARGAGVSSGAAYRHFAERDDVLREVARRGAAKLAARVARESVSLRGRERLAAVGRGYIHFAREEPHLFALVFGSLAWSGDRLRHGETEGDRPTGADPSASAAPLPSAFEQLREAVADHLGIDCGSVRPADLSLAWAAVHGAASLVASGVWSGRDTGVDEVIDGVVDALAEGGSAPAGRRSPRGLSAPGSEEWRPPRGSAGTSADETLP